MRTGVYGRLSVARESGNGVAASTDRQLADMVGWVKRQDGEITRSYRDDGISGFTGKHRPDFERLLADLDEGTIDTVVCWKLDRLARNHRDFQRLWEVCERRGARLVSLHEMFDSTTAAGEFVVRMLIGMAKMESANISLRVKRALTEARTAGRLHTGGERPFGHTRSGALVRREAAVVRWAALRVLAGDTLRAIVADATRKGITSTAGKPLGRLQLRRILLSPRVAGLVAHEGEVVGQGSFAPILQRGTWERVRTILKGRTWDPRPRAYLLVGWLRCGRCGAQMISRPIHGRRTYVCAATGALHLTVAADPVEQLVTEQVLGRLDHKGLAQVLAEIEHAGQAAALAEQLAADEAALVELSGDYYQRHLIGKPEFLANRRALEDRVDAARAKLRRQAIQTGLPELPTGPGELRAAWPELIIAEQRAILGLVLDRAIVIRPATRATRTLDPERVEIPPESWKV